MIRLHTLVCSVILISALNQSIFANNNSETLKLVFALFRHGDRTDDILTAYPNDPHKNETYYPYGLGQLTNEGKRRLYCLGKKLRRRYNDFLGNLYTPDILEAVSSEANRTKMSLELVLAGLFPSKGTLLEWTKDINWQPIPYNYKLFANDHMLAFPLFYCPSYAKMYEDYIKSPEGQEIEHKYSGLYPYLSVHTGLNVTSLIDVFLLYFGLTSQKEWGLELPQWTSSVYPEYLQNGTTDFYVLSSGNTKLKQLSGGFLLKRIITDIKLKLNNNLIPRDRKIFLYSGHEINVAYLLRAMNVFYNHVPHYGSCIMIEVHTIDNIDGVKVYYEDYSGAAPKILTVPGCESFCPFERFVKLLNKNLPISDDMCGEDLAILRKYENSRKRYVGI